MGCQPGKVSRLPSALVSRLTPEPGDHPDDIHGSSIQELLKVCTRQANVPTAAEIKTPFTTQQKLTVIIILIWIIGVLIFKLNLGLSTFALSVVLANMTTALVMGAVALGLGRGNAKFVTLACINIVVASNAGGAFCPFGDVTSLMIWQAGKLAFLPFFKLFVPALLSWLIPAALMTLALPKGGPESRAERVSTKPGATAVVLLFAATIIISVLMNMLLGLPPVAGMVLGLGLLQGLAYFTQRRKDDLVLDSFREMQRIEWDTLLFFFGIMFSIGGLAHLGWLALANNALYAGLSPTLANIFVGPLSAVLDNVPLVYAVLQMNPQMDESQWLLLALSAGVGGSMLSIGSSAGIALMGLAGKDYTFGKHLRWLPAIALGFAASVIAHFALTVGLGG